MRKLTQRKGVSNQRMSYGTTMSRRETRQLGTCKSVDADVNQAAVRGGMKTL